MWEKNLKLWLLSLSAATIFYHILPGVMPLKGPGLLFHGFTFFLFFSAITAGTTLSGLKSKTIHTLISVIAAGCVVVVYMWPSPLLFSFLCVALGVVLSKEYERILLSGGNMLRQFSIVYAGILCCLIPGVLQVRLPELFFPALSATSLLLCSALRFQGEIHQHQTDQQAAAEISKSGIIALWLALSLESLMIVWLVMLTSSESSQDVLPLFVVAIGLFILRRFAGRPIIVRTGDGMVFIFSLVLTSSLGFMFTLSTPWIFVFTFLLAQAWYPSLLARSQGVHTEFRHFRYFPFFLGLLMLISGFSLKQLYSFLEGMSIPQRLYFLAMKQAYIKELAFFSAILIFLSGFRLVRGIFWKPSA